MSQVEPLRVEGGHVNVGAVDQHSPKGKWRLLQTKKSQVAACSRVLGVVLFISGTELVPPIFLWIETLAQC